ncbi:acetylserotonin O-methyltransferase [Ideonella sp. A 288]|uniref:acetylserotonin O-methyltransferase n=1 Tax=Ideonella sp. A 288 TaxID=1962181 RepID=UPI001F293487|nr:acetylserotonin O-methyltransferase [Ideonella sp. A 288]
MSAPPQAPGAEPAMSAATSRLPWRERWQRWRDTLLANPRFRHWAAGFALTRPVARRRAAALFDLVAGFVYSQVLLACVRLRLFDLLADGPLPLSELARRTQLSDEACLRLLVAAQSLQLLQPRGGDRWGLGPLGATLVGDQAITAMVEHHAALYADLADPVALLRGEHGRTRLGELWAYAADEQPDQLARERVAAYSALMSASQPLVSEQVLDAVSLQGHRCLMDVGGGEGTFLRAVAARAPHLKLMLFDLPAVAGRARERLVAAGLAARAEVHGGDFHRQPLPRGADVITLVRVVHDHDQGAALRILAAVRAALPPGGRVLLAEPLADTPGAAAMGNAYFGFYLLAMGSGRARSAAELGDMLRASGFERVQSLPTRQPLQTALLSAWVSG